jgi:pimeloyl-ACP methyl ester carboxylesterase
MAISISGGHGMESGRAVRDEADFLQRWPMQDVKERINDITCPVCWLYGRRDRCLLG